MPVQTSPNRMRRPTCARKTESSDEGASVGRKPERQSARPSWPPDPPRDPLRQNRSQKSEWNRPPRKNAQDPSRRSLPQGLRLRHRSKKPLLHPSESFGANLSPQPPLLPTGEKEGMRGTNGTRQVSRHRLCPRRAAGRSDRASGSRRRDEGPVRSRMAESAASSRRR